MHHFNKIKTKNHIIASIGAGKAFSEMELNLMVKTLSKIGMEGMFYNITKALYEKSNASIILNVERLKIFHKCPHQAKMSTFSIAVQHSTGSPSHSYWAIKRRKNSNGK